MLAPDFLINEQRRLRLRNLDEAILYKLRGSRYGIRVDFDSGNSVRISPSVFLGGGATEFDLHTLSHQVGNKLPVWISSGDSAIFVICLIVNGDVPGICMEDRNRL